eukprot:GHVL01043283.1.p1 GENE.GHVL01043283.1~~GHVL01043283.1.p1  ORF type:complete len:317 (+),score=59.32 GHVL01043283.1:30-980(+)
MAARKTCVVLVVDCGESMQQPLFKSGTKSAFEFAKEAILLYMQQKMVVSPKHEISIVGYGCSSTENKLASESPGYENVVSFCEPPSPLTFHTVGHIKSNMESSSNRSDLLDGLIVGQDILNRHTKGKTYNRQIMIFTDGRTPIESPEDFQPVSDNIKETNVSLSIIGFGFANDEDQSQAFKDSQRGCTESILSKFVNSVDGIIVPSGSILDALHEFHKRQVAQVSKCRCELTIGTQLAIPIWVYLKTKKETLPSLKKRSRVGSNGSVKMSRAHFRVDDPEGPEVFIDNRIKGYKYGKDLVNKTVIQQYQFINKTVI